MLDTGAHNLSSSFMSDKQFLRSVNKRLLKFYSRFFSYLIAIETAFFEAFGTAEVKKNGYLRGGGFQHVLAYLFSVIFKIMHKKYIIL